MAKVKVDDMDLAREPVVNSDDIEQEKIVEKIVKETFTDSGDIVVDNTIPIIVGVVVGLLTLLLIYLISKRRSLGRGKNKVLPLVPTHNYIVFRCVVVWY